MEGNRRPRAYYVAGPFCKSKWTCDSEVKAILDDLGFETLPAQGGQGHAEDYAEQGMTLAQARHHVFEQNLYAIEASDVLLFPLDGQTPSEDACIEAGFAFGRGKRCIGLKTDSRNAAVGSNSLMIEGVLGYEIAGTPEELRELLAEERTVVDLRTGDDDIVVDLRSLENPYVAVSGPLGVGKTTLIEMMGRVGNWTILPEPVVENPYLSEVYSNLSDLSFRMQTFYLGQRALQHHSVKDLSGPLLQERCLSEDGEVFTPAYRDHGAYDDNDLATLMTLYRGLMAETPRPDLLVYLAAPFEVTVDRIRNRDRIAERDVDLGLIRVIYDRYEQWARDQSQVPLLRIDTSELDYVNRAGPAAEIAGRINAALTEVAVSA